MAEQRVQHAGPLTSFVRTGRRQPQRLDPRTPDVGSGAGEMDAEIESVGARLIETSKQRPLSLGHLLFGVFRALTGHLLEMAGDILAFLHSKRTERLASTECEAHQ